MCLYPKLVRNRRFTSTKKNGGNIPPLPLYTMEDGTVIQDHRVMWIPVGCQKCMECKKQKSNSWKVRLLEDVRHNKNGVMITLTFSDESIAEIAEVINQRGVELDGYDLDNEIAKVAMRRFLERWRKKFKKSVRHWFVTELGHNGTENIHMHGILWTDEKKETIEEIWKYGYIWYGDGKTKGWVNEQTVGYIVKYVNKIDADHKEYEPRVLTSAGIGADYTKRDDFKRNRYNGVDTKESYRTKQGFEMNMPAYWRNKRWTDEEREALWINKLNAMVRYVGGEKVDISKSEEGYYKLLKYWRGVNGRLGYGDDKINWSRKRYEREKRNLLTKKRIERASLPKSSTKKQRQ